MKKIIIMVFALILLTGSVMADPGLNQTPESQGIATATTLELVGNFASTTDIQWRITNDEAGLDGIPELDMFAVVYASTYNEDTYSNGIGLIAYDKNMDVETSDQLSGQWNIDADKQLEFVGVDGARAYSDEYIMVDGVGTFNIKPWKMLCIFASEDNLDDFIIPPFCNFAEAGSTVDMTVANVRTNSMDRFIMPTADTTVELEHDIAVSELITDLPSMGSASAFMNALIMEGCIIEGYEPCERIEFGEVSSVSGDITAFLKDMNYVSGMRR